VSFLLAKTGNRFQVMIVDAHFKRRTILTAGDLAIREIRKICSPHPWIDLATVKFPFQKRQLVLGWV